MIAFAALLWLAAGQAEPAPDSAPTAVSPVEGEAPPAACALPDAPVVEIGARVRARSLKFTQAGDTEVRIWSEPGGEGEWKLDRGPLPDPIPVGKTFRDVDVTLEARADLTDHGLAVTAGAARTSPPEAPAAPCN